MLHACRHPRVATEILTSQCAALDYLWSSAGFEGSLCHLQGRCTAVALTATLARGITLSPPSHVPTRNGGVPGFHPEVSDLKLRGAAVRSDRSTGF